jgi:AraC-like DNA-binding protein
MAQEAGLSRSVFFERFRRAVGVAPMEYRAYAAGGRPTWRENATLNVLAEP